MKMPYGIPFTEAQRQARHYSKHGTSDPPPRGSGFQFPDPIKEAGELFHLITTDERTQASILAQVSGPILGAVVSAIVGAIITIWLYQVRQT